MNKHNGILCSSTATNTVVTDSLILDNMGNPSGKTMYGINNGRTITINRYLGSINFSDCKFVELKANSTSNATLAMGNLSTVSLSNVHTYYVLITGPNLPYPVENYYFLGGTSATCWVNSTPESIKRLYRINGAGNWNDPSHWSLSSGGASSCYIPDASTTLVFDDNSGLTDGMILAPEVSVVCDSMLWIGSSKPVFDMANRTVTISGSLQLQPGMTITGITTGGIIFNSKRPEGETIITHSVSIPKTITFSGAGTWTLQDSLKTTNSITFNNETATLNVNGTINCTSFSSANGTLNLNGTISTSNYFILSNGTLNLNGAFNIGTYFNLNNGTLNVKGLLNIGTTFTFSNGFLNLEGGKLVCATMTATANNNRKLSMINGTIEMDSWTYTNANSLPLTRENTAGSLIRVKNAFTGKPTDYYHNVEAGSGTLQGGIFNKIIMNKHNGILCSSTAANSVVTDSLILDNKGNPSGIATYYIYRGRAINVNRYLGNINVTNCQFVEFKSDANTVATISTGNDMEVNFTNLTTSYIGILGEGAPYPVSNYVDQGGSFGFSNTGEVAGTLYWVNGSGSWQDPAHWAMYCEGGTKVTGFFPSANTTVIFDENSGLTDGATVTLNGNAFCDSMLWTGVAKPVFNLRNYDLTINGSLLLQPKMQITSSLAAGYINFTSERQNETITTNNVQIPRPVFFNNPAGGWKIEDALLLKSGITLFNLTFIDGNLHLNGKIQCGSFISNAHNARILDISNAVIDAENWLHNNGAAPLTAAQSENSIIRINNNFTGLPADHYNVVEAGAGVLQAGNFKKIIMMKDKGMLNTSLTGNWVITDSLVLYMGNEYKIYRGSTVQVKHYFGNIENVGDCAERIELRSDAAAAAFIKMGNDFEMDLSGISFYYIVMDGPEKPYNIPQANDLGGSSGFVSDVTNTFYWVNGPGKWSDGNHWSTSSGGPADACVIPQSEITVIFDDNSGLTNGSTVTLDVDATCDSMLWKTTTQPIFNMATFNLNIHGSLQLQPKMTLKSTTGTLTLSSARGINETIKTNHITIPRDIVLNNAAGKWEIQDSLKLAGNNLTLTNGELNLNGNYMQCGAFTITGTAVRKLNIAHSVIDVDSWTYNGGGATPLSSAQTADSHIRVAGDFTGKANDNYATVEAGTGTIQGGVFKKIIMSKEGSMLNGTNSANAVKTDSLIFEMGKTYFLRTNVTTIVSRYLGNTRSTGACTEKVTLRSTSAAAAASLSLSGAVVNLNNVDFYYVNATGNTPYPVPNSINLGGLCSGWTFSSPPAVSRLYWVGGSGNWHETMHWALTSGGEPACYLPSNKTTVIFDDNSGLTNGKTVSISGIATCDSMLWTGSQKPVLDITAALIISGSLELQPNMSVTSANYTDITFNSTRLNETIKTNNVPINQGVIFNSATGGWKLQDALLTTNTINFTNGDLDLSGSYVKAGAFTSTFANSRKLNMANSTIELTGAWQHTGSTVALAPANTQNSKISYVNSFTGQNGDQYNVVTCKPAATPATLQGGSFTKIMVAPDGTNRTLIFNDATAAHNVTTDSLIFTSSFSGFTCMITGNSHLTINQYLGNGNPGTDCALAMTLKSSATSPCFINMGNDAEVQLSNVTINNVTISGQDAPYSVTNAIDLGGNTGWTNAPSRNVYWIGGNGSWNTLSHWSYQSGGAPNVCEIPNGLTTVIFDDNSGLTNTSIVFLDGNFACDSMIWRGTTAPLFSMTNKTLTISGSLELQPKMRITATTGGIVFNGRRATGETIKTNHVQIPCDITFNHPDGSWRLLDSLIQTGTGMFFFTDGALDFSGQYLKTGNFSSTAANNRQLDITNALVDVASWTYTGNAVPPVTANSTVRCTTNFTCTPGNRYHILEIANGSVIGGTFSKILAQGFVSFNNHAAGVIHTDTLLFGAGALSAKIFAGSSVNVKDYMARLHHNWLSLASTSPTVSAMIHMGENSAQSDVKMDTLMLKRITITGPGVDYPTTGSVDEGNNVGWQFIPDSHIASDDYYWREDAPSLIFNNIDNWEVGYPGSKVRPLTIFNSSHNIHFPPSSTHADRTLTLTGTPSINFNTLCVSEGSCITIELGTVPVNAQENIIVNAGLLTLSGTGTLTALGDIITHNYTTLNIENMNVVAANIHLNHNSKCAIGITSTTINTATNLTVLNDVLVNDNSELSLTKNNINIGNALSVEGTFKYTTNINATFDVGGNVTVKNNALCNISNTSSSTVTTNFKKNTWVANGGTLNLTGTSTGVYMLNWYAAGNVNIEGTASIQNTKGYFKENLTATGGVLFYRSNTYLQSTNPYIFNLGPQTELYFTEGSLRFDAPAAFTLPFDLIIPTTDLYFTANNGSFTSGGHALKALKLFSGLGAGTGAGRKLDFSGSLIEVQEFEVHGTVAGEYDFTGTTVSFFGKENHIFKANLISSSPIYKVTYSEAANLITFTYPTYQDGNNKTVTVTMDNLVTGDKAMRLDFTGGNITANHWNIERYCDIYTTNSPVINVGAISCPPPAIKCVGISQMHSTNGAIMLNRLPATGSQELRNIYFRNVAFGGTGTGAYSTAFNIPYNYDLGGNSGSVTWTSPPDSEESIDFFWIGGTGNWMSDQNWSFTSGGEPANCIPTFLDNAIFDKNSFTAANQTVTVDSVPTGIHHIIWTDPTLRGRLYVDNILEIYGSVNFTGCSIITSAYTSSNGKFIFLGRGNETITSRNCVFNIPIVQFDHSGTYEMKDNFTHQAHFNNSAYGIFHYSGTLVSQGHTIRAHQFHSSSPYSALRAIDFSNTSVLLPAVNMNEPDETSNWTLDLSNLTACDLSNSYIMAMSVRTNGAVGQSVQYHDVEVYYAISQNAGLIVSYNDIYAMGKGITGSINQGSFYYGFTARNLYLKAYKQYSFNYNTTLPNEFIITGTFTTDAHPCECNSDTQQTIIQGNYSSYLSKINVVNAPFELTRVTVKNINSVGAPMYVSDGVDGGNNMNVVVTPHDAVPGRDFYWVPNNTAGNTGSGNWNDATHWSLDISGGDPAITNPNHCIPSRYDNLFFDINSFTAVNQKITVNTNISCNNMTWKPEINMFTPSLSETDVNIYALSVYGSLELASGIKEFRIDDIEMRGTSNIEGAQTIRFNGLTGQLTLDRALKFMGGGRYDILDSYQSRIGGNNSSVTTHGVIVDNNSKLYVHGNLECTNLYLTGSSSLFAHGTITTLYQLNAPASTLPRTIDLSGAKVDVNQMSLILDNYSTVNLSNANINLRSTNAVSTFTFNDAPLCSWAAANSVIRSPYTIHLNNNTAKTFAFHNIIMTGQSEASATLGTGATTGAFAFNKVQFVYGQTLLANSNALYTFDTLQYALSSNNKIAGGKRLDINKKLIASGTPCGTLSLTSTGAPALINSVNCNPAVIQYACITNVYANANAGCPSSNYIIYGTASQQSGYNGWTLYDKSGVAELLGNDTVLDCRTPLPFIQTTEGLGIGSKYTWYYRPEKGTGAWTILTHGTFTPEYGIAKTGEYSLFIEYATGCELGGGNSIIRFVTIDQDPPPATITSSSTTNNINEDELTITLIADKTEDPLGNSYNYSWKDTLGNHWGSNPKITVSTPGIYTVTVVNDRSCVDSAKITIHQYPTLPNLYVQTMYCQDKPLIIDLFADHNIISCDKNKAEVIIRQKSKMGNEVITKNNDIEYTHSGVVGFDTLKYAVICENEQYWGKICISVLPAPHIVWVTEPTATISEDTLTVKGAFANIGTESLESPIFFTYYINDILTSNIMTFDSLFYTLKVDSTFNFELVLNDLSSYGNYESIWLRINDRNGNYPYRAQCKEDGRRLIQILGGAPLELGTLCVGNHPSCGNKNGSILLYVRGGSGRYEYSINGGAFKPYTNSLIGGLPAGTYRIKVRDKKHPDVTIMSNEVTLRNINSDISLFVTSTDASTCSLNDGSLSVVVRGGTKPYTLTMNGVATNETVITGLQAGVYVIEAKDAEGCVASSGEVRISVADTHFEINLLECTGSSCGKNEGTVRLDIQSTVPYRYQLDGMAVQNGISNRDTVEFTDLSAGSHLLHIFNSCGEETFRFDVVNSAGTSSDLAFKTNVAQNVVEFLDGTVTYGEIDLVVTGGVSPYSYTINGGATWKPFSGTKVTIGNLEEGWYKIEVKDASGCTYTVNTIRIIRIVHVCPESVTDIESHIYPVIKLAGLCWTSNLRTTKYADGADIPFAKPYTCPTCPAQLDTIFGLLYDWYSAVGALDVRALRATPVQGICPDGWHIPSQAELSLLGRYPAKDLMSTDYWLVPGTNLTGFDSRPAGRYNGALNRFEDLYGFTAYWTCDADPRETATTFTFTYYCNETQNITILKTDGISVRCVWNGEEHPKE